MTVYVVVVPENNGREYCFHTEAPYAWLQAVLGRSVSCGLPFTTRPPIPPGLLAVQACAAAGRPLVRDRNADFCFLRHWAGCRWPRPGEV